MKKILVTTDFSSNSKAGLRFAIQLAKQEKVKLTFFHSYYIMRPTSWNDVKFAAYEKGELKKIQARFEKFVRAVYRGAHTAIKKVECVLSESVLVDSNIIDYAKLYNYDYICISTRGAGKFKRIFGTNTSNVIKNSEVPVLAVPHRYRSNKIQSVLYASDLIDLDKELIKVLAFTKTLKPSIELLHFDFPQEIAAKQKIMNEAKKKYSKQKIKLHLEDINLAKDFTANIESAVKRSKPSLLIMFHHKNKDIFDKIFVPSYSAEYSFDAKIPMLVFNKT